MRSLAAPGDIAVVLGGLQPVIDYNWYHQIGIDYAQVIGDFNVRAELAASLTSDLAGNDGGVHNPSLAWSLGFDRDILWGINLNFQAGEKIILLHSRIDDNPAPDTEAGTSVTSTRIICSLSRKFLRDELEAGVKAIWGIEDNDFLIAPSLTWTKGDISIDCTVGIPGGDEAGQLGQYRENSFVKIGLTYTF